ncbi:hypothetical protein ACN47E_009206 [Coniothyrium glycines]
MKLSSKPFSTRPFSRWSFSSIGSFIAAKTKSTDDKPAEEGVVGVDLIPNWLAQVPDSQVYERIGQEENNHEAQHVRFTPSITPLYRGRNQFIQGSLETSSGRRDTRRYGVYLGDYDLMPHEPEQRHSVLRVDSVDPVCAAARRPTSCQRSRQPRVRRPRQDTYRPDDEHAFDPPPQYSALDPHSFTGRRRRHGKISLNIVKGMEDMGKMALDLPATVKGAQEKVQVRRAKGKIRWLERHDFLSAQERLLGEELRG